jgi:hypothetical protein
LGKLLKACRKYLGKLLEKVLGKLLEAYKIDLGKLLEKLLGACKKLQ